MRYSTKVTRRYLGQAARERAQQIEAARQGIPVNAYLRMLHVAACTGELPHYDPDTGALRGTADHIDPKERTNILLYLVDKALPNLQRVAPPPEENVTPQDLDTLAPADVAAMTTDQLTALVVAGKDIRDAAYSSSAADPKRAGPA
jgi:hypothetical protein